MMVRGGRVRGSDEDILYNGIRNWFRFEAADRAASPQEAVQVNCAGQSELV